LLLALWFCLAAGAGAEPRVYFNPPLAGDRPVADYIVEAIDSAQTQILVQQYQLTEPAIIAALIKAKRRGVQVEALFDKTVGPAANTLKDAGIMVVYDPVHIAHNKILILDGRLVIGGSFNLTGNANRRNCENCLFMDDLSVVLRFIANYQARQAAAQKE
jgi:phosphatidylserine/phosphatidylglycerophosphate/cardiolipin synthase-like enzyme